MSADGTAEAGRSREASGRQDPKTRRYLSERPERCHVATLLAAPLARRNSVIASPASVRRSAKWAGKTIKVKVTASKAGYATGGQIQQEDRPLNRADPRANLRVRTVSRGEERALSGREPSRPAPVSLAGENAEAHMSVGTAGTDPSTVQIHLLQLTTLTRVQPRRSSCARMVSCRRRRTAPADPNPANVDTRAG
jgi:hypothetical protein